MIKMATISRRQLFEIVHASHSIVNVEAVCKLCMNHVLDHYSVNQAAFSEGLYSTTCSQLKDFLYELKRRWGWSNRTVNVFLQKNKSWLDKDITFSVEISNVLTNKSRENIPSTSAECLQDQEETSEESRVGRPTKNGMIFLKDHGREEHRKCCHIQNLLNFSMQHHKGCIRRTRILSMYLKICYDDSVASCQNQKTHFETCW